MTGRPSSYSEDVAASICAGLSEGIPLAVICRDGKAKDPSFPCDDTVRNWMTGNAEFAQAYARARAAGFDALAKECLDIADTPLEGEETVTKADGAVEVRKGDMLGHRKLQIETRLKLLAKWDPKRYGDSVQLKHADADGEKLPISETDTAARVAALIAIAQQRSSSVLEPDTEDGQDSRA